MLGGGALRGVATWPALIGGVNASSSFMVSSSEVWVACPSISFLFARLGGSLGVFPYLANFVFEGSGLSVALADLLPLLRQSLDWFDDLVRERRGMSEVRYSELETGLSSNDGPVEAGGDSVVSVVREVKAFHALDEGIRVPMNNPHWLDKRRPKLKSRYKERVEKAIEYVKTIEDFDDLVDPRTLVFYCLGPDPSTFVLRSLDIEEKKRMTTKFNQSMYARIRVKKNEPLSNLGAKTVRVTEKGAPVTIVTPLTPDIESIRTASPDTSIEEINPRGKRQRAGDKQREKVDSQASSVWDDAGVAWSRAQDTFTTNDMKVFSGVPANELVLGESLHITSEYLAQETKVVFAVSRVDALEAKNSKLKKDLITAMGEANIMREKLKVMGDDLRVERQLLVEKDEQLLAAKEKIKTIAAKAVEAFQQTDEHNNMLFSWYFKRFELLRCYLIKHPAGVDMENLDLKEVDREMTANEVSQPTALEGDAPETTPVPSTNEEVATDL
ncbi:hypothetical protein SO802_021736 [Lithocarpus litseifolius]|uniref:Uncharacterized protein n=1 Tax=Lithocarpus litseifolius TaxID=425828 RepID=A0AAW2CKM1_9ROSI